MNIIVTGATGFIGLHLCKYLLKKNHKVSALVRQTSDTKELKSLGVHLFFGDITDLKSLKEAAQYQESIFHLAALVSHDSKFKNQMYEINVTGTKNILQIATELKIQKFLHVSSVVTIGATRDKNIFLNEKSPYQMKQYHLGYFDTKKKAEELVFKAIKENKLQAIIVNPSTVYGPGDMKKKSRKIQAKVARGKFPFYTSGGVNIIGINELIEGLYSAWEKGKVGERYILGGENISIKKLFFLISKYSQQKEPKVLIPYSLLLTLGILGDVLKIFKIPFFVSKEMAITSSFYHWYDSKKAIVDLNLKTKPANKCIQESLEAFMKSSKEA